MKNLRLLLAALAFIGATAQVTIAQQVATFQPNNSKLEIKGTSNLHEWEEFVESFNVQLEFVSENNAIKGIRKVVFTGKSASVESDNSIMTNKTHEALKTDKFPDIKFTQTSEGSFSNDEGTLSGSISGNLALAGVTKMITLPFEGKIASGTMYISGTQKLKMSDFDISAPTALLGSLKTGDEVELVYSLQFLID
jgi:polyisoprenoid-binding protein YceI